MARRATSSMGPILLGSLRSRTRCWTKAWCDNVTAYQLCCVGTVSLRLSTAFFCLANRDPDICHEPQRIAEPIIADPEERFEGFENLMPFKVHNILLVSSLYDSFILREDGRLNELLIDQSLDLSPEHVPGITHVSSCAQAAELARSQQFNLIVTNLAVGE